MSAIASPLSFAVMAKRSTADKEPVNLRITGKLLDEAREYINAQPAKPTLTNVFEAALAEWLDRHHKPRPRPGK